MAWCPVPGDASPLRDQRRFSVPVHRDPKAPAGSVLGVEDGAVAVADLRDADPALAGKRLGQRPFHGVLQASERVAVARQPVVLRDAPVLGLELRDDTEVGIDDPLRPPNRLAPVQVGRALGADDAGGHFQPDPRVDAAVTAMIAITPNDAHFEWRLTVGLAARSQASRHKPSI